jgi:hypothetical protein
MDEPRQIFILGCARSGTSVVYRAVRQVLGLPGEGESHVLPIFVRLMHEYKLYVDQFKGREGLLAASLELRTFRTALVNYIRGFYEREYPQGSWVDKTPGPEGTIGVTFIVEAFPAARIIATRRNGVEVVESFRRKFSSSFEEACQAWATSMAALEQILIFCPAILCVDQFDLANEPERMGPVIADHFLCPGKGDALAAYFAANREDRNSSHEWGVRLTPRTAGWTADEVDVFVRVCGDLMRRGGYET